MFEQLTKEAMDPGSSVQPGRTSELEVSKSFDRGNVDLLHSFGLFCLYAALVIKLQPLILIAGHVIVSLNT